MAAEVTRVVVTDPDPTEAVKEALALGLNNLDIKVSQRFDANDKALELAREEVKSSARDLAKSQADALAAALKATTDANLKLDQSFEKSNGATNEKIDRLTERINIWTGRDNTAADSKQDRSSDRGYTLQIIIALIAGAGFVLAALPHFK